MEEKKKALVTLAVMAGVALILVGVQVYLMSQLGVAPLDGEESLKTKIKGMESEKSRLEKIQEVTLPQKEEELDKLMSVSADAIELLPDEVKPEQVMEFIIAKAFEAQVNLLDYSEAKKRRAFSAFGRGPSNPWEEIKFELILSGTYDQLALFINYIEIFEMQGPEGKPISRFFAVENPEIEVRQKGVHETGFHEMKVEIVTYKFKQPTGKKLGR
jgi:hypothetical protein